MTDTDTARAEAWEYWHNRAHKAEAKAHMLLVALKEIEPMLGRFGRSGHDMRARARAAIAMAEGKS